LAKLLPQGTNTRIDVFFPRDHREGRQVWSHHDIGKTALPVTEFEVGQNVFSNIPTKEDITLGKAIIQRIEEVAARDALPPEDAFHIGCANFDKFDCAVVDLALNF